MRNGIKQAIKKSGATYSHPKKLPGAVLLETLRSENTMLMTAPNSKPPDNWILFQKPLEILRVSNPEELLGAFTKLQESLTKGLFAAGYISYEAARAFEPKCELLSPKDFPLLEIAIFGTSPQRITLPKTKNFTIPTCCLPEINKSEYAKSFFNIREKIEKGDIYQANLTFRSSFNSYVPPEELFLSLCNNHPVSYAAYLNFGSRKVVSLSPELFLESDSQNITSIPMKGTLKRHPDRIADAKIAKSLAKDPKNTSENLMITDMVRNDLSRVCSPGSVVVDELFRVDTYKTLHQLVSVVRGKLRKGISIWEILRATFPPASISGAPKISAVNILARNEISPRKIYTGCIGCFFPNGEFRLNVAIRTLLFEGKSIEIGLGGGITYESKLDDEWNEAMLKSTFATGKDQDFDIFETLLWTRAKGFLLKGKHIERISKSCKYFGRTCNVNRLKLRLAEVNKSLLVDIKTDCACVKIAIDSNSEIKILISPPRLPNWSGEDLRVLISHSRTNSDDIFLRHKTTRRKLYDECLRNARKMGFHEVIFFNQNGELTEGSISNIFLLSNGQWHTPHLDCGLLAGTWRANMVHKLKAKESKIFLKDLLRAEKVILGNSVRGFGTVKHLESEHM